MSEFWEKYRDPRWQKRRLEIMEIAGFKCESCGTDKDTLNVHHRSYFKDRDPWDYSDRMLVCLCEKCHQESHDAIDELKFYAGQLPHSVILQLVGYSQGLFLQFADDVEDATITLYSSEQAGGIADSYGLYRHKGEHDLWGEALPKWTATNAILEGLADRQRQLFGCPFGWDWDRRANDDLDQLLVATTG